MPASLEEMASKGYTKATSKDGNIRKSWDAAMIIIKCLCAIWKSER